APGSVLTWQKADIRRIGTTSVPRKWRIDRVQVEVEVLSSLFIEGRVSLGDYAGADGDAVVALQFGHVNGGVCRGIASATEYAQTGTYTWQHHFDGVTPSSWGAKPARPWDCGVAATLDPHNGQILHQLAGPLRNSYEAPKLKLGTVKVLGQKQKK